MRELEKIFLRGDSNSNGFYEAFKSMILISSFGSAITLSHFLHLTTSNGSYIGIYALTLGSEVDCSKKILLTETKKHYNYHTTNRKSMKSNEEISLEDIMKKLETVEKAQAERSFLSRLDMMVSIILTLTFFMLSFILNNFRPDGLPSSLIFSFLVALLSLFIFIVQGEIRAIIANDKAKRFDYWVTLIWGLSQTCILFILMFPYTFGFGLQILLLTLLTPLIIILVVYLAWWIERAFNWYNQNLLVEKLEDYRSSLQTLMKSIVLMVATFLITFFLVLNM